MLHNLYFVVREIKLRTIRWVGQLARMWYGSSRCLTNVNMKYLAEVIARDCWEKKGESF
jgi:hypothetical protein